MPQPDVVVGGGVPPLVKYESYLAYTMPGCTRVPDRVIMGDPVPVDRGGGGMDLGIEWLRKCRTLEGWFAYARYVYANLDGGADLPQGRPTDMHEHAETLAELHRWADDGGNPGVGECHHDPLADEPVVAVEVKSPC